MRNSTTRERSQGSYTKQGWLTAYALACGGVDSVGEFVTIEHSQSHYHVKRHPAHPGGHVWLVYERLDNARRAARKLAVAS